MIHTPTRQRRLTGSLALHGVLLIVVAISLAPILVVWMAALKSGAELSVHPLGVPHHWVWSNLSQAWRETHMGQFIKNSVIVTIPAVLIVLACAACAAYSLAIFEFRGRGLIFGLFLLGLVVPAISFVVALYYTEQTLGLLNTRSGLILAEVAQALPLAILILRSSFRDLPGGLREAALVDGASELSVLVRVYLPLARPALAGAAVLTFLTVWNDYLLPLILINSSSLQTLPLGLAFINSTYVVSIQLVAAATSLASLPSIAIYILLQRQFIRGVTEGALK